MTDRNVLKEYESYFDELNKMVTSAYSDTDTTAKGKIGILQDMYMSFMIGGYVKGHDYADNMILNATTGLSEKNIRTNVDADRMQEELLKRFDGKDYNDRIREYVMTDDIQSLLRVAETEYHRMYNAGSMDACDSLSAGIQSRLNKTWVTMNDSKVRDTHDFLEGVSVGLNERFYTYDDDSARFPGDFAKVENNVNCRCVLSISAREGAV